MTDQDLTAIVNQELKPRPIHAPSDVQGYMDLVYRELRYLPANEVRLAVRAFYEKPVCVGCARSQGRWPHPEEIRAQIPQTVVDKTSQSAGHNPNCSFCEGTGWVRVERGELSGVYRCEA